MELKNEVKEAALNWLDAHPERVGGRSDGPSSARAIRGGYPSDGDTSGLVAAMLAVFDGYEAVEVQEPNYRYPWRLRGQGSWDRHKRHFTVYMKKPTPQTVTVTRETLAVLAETVRDIPKTNADTAAALREADALL